MKYRKLIPPAVFLLAFLFACMEGDYRRITDTVHSMKGKPEITVVIVGDSISGADAYGGGLSYGAIIRSKFAELLGSRVSLINSSRPNLTFGQARRFYQEDILSFRPDVVFIMLGTVDMNERSMYSNAFRDAVSSYFNLLAKEDILVVVLTPTGFRDKQTNDEMSARLGEISGEVTRQARICHFPVIDMTGRMEDLWSSDPDRYRSMFSDSVHLSAEGHAFVADTIMEAVRNAAERTN